MLESVWFICKVFGFYNASDYESEDGGGLSCGQIMAVPHGSASVKTLQKRPVPIEVYE
jgi:hypothetical protein